MFACKSQPSTFEGIPEEEVLKNPKRDLFRDISKKLLKKCRYCNFKKRICLIDPTSCNAKQSNCFRCQKTGHYPQSLNCKIKNCKTKTNQQPLPTVKLTKQISKLLIKRIKEIEFDINNKKYFPMHYSFEKQKRTEFDSNETSLLQANKNGEEVSLNSRALEKLRSDEKERNYLNCDCKVSLPLDTTPDPLNEGFNVSLLYGRNSISEFFLEQSDDISIMSSENTPLNNTFNSMNLQFDSSDETIEEFFEDKRSTNQLLDGKIAQLDGFNENSAELGMGQAKNIFAINCEREDLVNLLNFFRSFNKVWLQSTFHQICNAESNCFFCHIRSSMIRLRQERKKDHFQ